MPMQLHGELNIEDSDSEGPKECMLLINWPYPDTDEEEKKED